MKTVAIPVVILLCAIASHAHAQDQKLSPETTGWFLRAKAPGLIAKFQSIREADNWCLYELEQEQPDEIPCKLVKKLREDPTLTDEAAIIMKAIDELKKAKQTPLIQEHIRVLENAMHEITISLNPE